MEFAVLGSEEFTLGFRLAGVRRVYTVRPEEYEAKLLELTEDSTLGILAINSSDLTAVSANVRKKALESISPVVIQVGGEEGDLREKVKSAIGVDLYKSERD
ncbi:MAG TPA: V-type ATP synthase subunit F [Methanomassiliicoccaceae archaeon]|jgi:V/A-type H+-transporting ATPase subunit F|nr:V-type ATP synthase subunit F [Euryarchaeota archaeon]HOB38476.1 V-type ATP synthase subunit F [Methanomassiliicoccaceae archaeon]HOK28418.1 V-type ATP synthase subunit F [Methanomassiliicoccaceae archaeon]HOL06732.1 V-type ATP synthase subunit F [Methanomassiliicoccaceae archaeon]HOQ25414.1 V-type ATP synthase subunit F [Methanomassiliicoccaceae archaeon]